MIDDEIGLDKGTDATVADPGAKRDDRRIIIRAIAGDHPA